SGVSLLAAVLAYAAGARVAALGLAALTLLVDETGLLACPLFALYEAVFRVRWADRRTLSPAAVRVLPAAAVSAAYLALRAGAGGEFQREGEPCATLACLAVGALEYV